MPDKALVADNGKRVHVAGRRSLLAERLFRRDVVRGAHHHAGAGDRGGVRGLGDAEVGQLHRAVGPDHDVARLDVAVHVTAFVRGLQREAGLLQDVQGLLGGEAVVLGQDRGQRLALDQLHHQVRGVLRPVRQRGGLAVVVHGGDAGVVERCGRASLGAEAVQELGVAAQLRLEHLHRDPAVQSGVRGVPHLTHPADRDPAIEPVAIGEQLSRGQHRLSSPRPRR